MHSNVTIKNVSWPHFSWATLYSSYTSQSIAVVTTAPDYLFIARQSRNASKFNRLYLRHFQTDSLLYFHQNSLLFKGYKVSYNRKCRPLPVQFRNSQPQPLKLGRGCFVPFGEGAGSPSNTNSPGLRPTSVPSGILMHPAVWAQQK